MAVVKGPALSLDASGNLGAVCYARWRDLAIARGVWTGTVPNTTKQQTIQGFMTTVSQAWSGTLTDAQRKTWIEAAREQIRMSRVKTPYQPTGYQYFMQRNIQVLRQGYAMQLSLPPALPSYGFTALVTGWAAGGPWITFRTSGNLIAPPGGYRAEFWVAGPYDGGGRHAIEPEYKFYIFHALGATRGYPPTVAGKWYWVKARWIEKFGKVGNWFEKQQYAG